MVNHERMERDDYHFVDALAYQLAVLQKGG
jgi:hypothetical protein